MRAEPSLLKVLDEPDPMLSLVVVGHLNLEALLTRVLEATLVEPNLLLDRAMFAQKVSIAQATGVIDADMATVLRGVNKVRNRFAHQLDFTLTFDEAFTLVKLAADRGVDFSDDTIHQDRQRSEEWYGVQGIVHEVLANTFTALAFAVEREVPDVTRYLN